MKKIFPVSLILFLILISQTLSSQIFPGNENKSVASGNIEKLHHGILIVPLVFDSKKLATLKKLSQDSTIEQKTREKYLDLYNAEKNMLNDFNEALIENFAKNYQFSEVRFADRQHLTEIIHNKKGFIDRKTMHTDTVIIADNRDLFVLRYYKTSEIASRPDEIRNLFIADSNFTTLQRPFPNSPGRQKSFLLRFRDLLNISPNTNDLIALLVTKLNDNLFRYQKR